MNLKSSSVIQKKVNDIIISINSSLKNAIYALEKSKNKLLICTKNKKFYGVLNDGDIRRAIIKGASTNSKIKNFINTNAVTVNESVSINEVSKLLSKRVFVIPVIDSNLNVKNYFSLEDKINNIGNLAREVTIVGQGYVGLTLSAILSSVGYRVYGYDKNKTIIKKLNQKKCPFFENGLQKYLNNNINKNLFFVDKISDAKSKNYIIAVGTPVKNKKANLTNLKKSIIEVGQILKGGDLIIMRSTLPLGLTNSLIIPLLEKTSKLKVMKDFSISFAPERTAEGVALKELQTNPQIIGGIDDISTERTASIFNNITHSIVRVPNIETAELCKLIDNSYRDHIFAYTNQFIPIAEKQGLNLSKIIDYVNHGYQRNNIPKPSPGVGGPCLTKDPWILNNNFKKNNIKETAVPVARKINENIIKYVYTKTIKLLKKLKKKKDQVNIFMIGMAFKGHPETSDYRDSTSLWLLKKFKNKKNISIFDPIISNEELKKIHPNVKSIKSGFKKCDVVFFLNNHESYQNYKIYDLIKKMNKPCLIVDTWNILNPIEIKQIKGVNYWGLGNGE